MNSTYTPPASLNQPAQPMSRIQFSIWNTFKHHISRFIITAVVDIVLPLVIYFSLQKYTQPVYALLVASSPPLFMVIFKAIFFCTFDALGFLVFITFAISAIVVIITRNPIILLLEKSLLTGIVSLIFAVTLLPIHCCHHRCRMRPLAYYLYQDLVPTTRADIGLPEGAFIDEEAPIDDQYTQLKEESSSSKLSSKQEVAKVYEWIYAHCSSFRSSCYLITSIWTIGFLLEFLARVSLILLNLSVNKIVIYGHIILTSITIICIASSIVCITIERKYTLLFIEQWAARHAESRTPERQTHAFRISFDRNSLSMFD